MSDNYDHPTTDEEAKTALRRPDDTLTSSLQEMYMCRRLQGENVPDAFQATLKIELRIKEYEPATS